ncbi:MAG TPA: c-type cytochrome [Acidimicrobiales bacterium]|nr:c-type cytochrome [Acidimicrobiales bacterium]
MRRPPLAHVSLAAVAAALALGPLALLAGAAGAAPGPFQTTRHNAGTPNSSQVTRNASGQIVSYGDKWITYRAPSAALTQLGQALYMENCASCHGTEANGVPAPGTVGAYPNLVGLGPATIDFWIVSGRMPAADPTAVQAPRRQPRLTPRQAEAIAAWINSLLPSYPYIPDPHVKRANVATGMALFALNCAACHTIEGDGDALAYATFAPSLRHIPAYQVAEAIRTGPGNMPRFTGNLSDQQVNDIVAYVTKYIQHPENPGGFGLGQLGPVAEGFVALVIGVGLLALIAYWIGERA